MTMTATTAIDARPTPAALRPEWAADQAERVTRRLDLMHATMANTRPGDVLAEGDGWRWLAYRFDDGRTVAACYVAGRLLRRDHLEWFVVDYWGKRVPIKGDPTDRLASTAPAGWPRHPEHLDIGGGGGG